MATSELSFQQIHEYFVKNGGSVANRDVVRYFKRYLTDPETAEDARQKFKKYVNQLATSRTEGETKILTLKSVYNKRYSTSMDDYPMSPKYDPRNSIGIPTSPVGAITTSPRPPPPYRPPPPVPSSPSASYDNISLNSSNLSLSNLSSTPQAPPRKKSSSDKAKLERCDSQADVNPVQEKENEKPENGDKQTISVKERTQKFNRLASVEDELSSPTKTQSKLKKKQKDKGADVDDGASVTSLDTKKCAEWYVAAAKGDYHELAKLACKETRLVKLKDPYTTVLHWGAKHGSVDIIKLFAGTYKADVNAKTNGGYVPLHLAAQFGRDEVFEILVSVYKADRDIRDFSGRKPEQYKASHIQNRPKTTNKLKGRKNKYGDKDLGFLRIGSLNVRVKKTTEAFSSFLGVGSGSMSSIDPITEKVHKGWGSADNIGQEVEMPAPKAYVTKRKSKRPLESSRTHSNPGTPNQPQRIIQRHSLQDSDSDTAAGFDSHWQN